MSQGKGERASTWPVILPALALLPGIAYTSVCYARWSGLDAAGAIWWGLPIFGALSLPMLLVLFRVPLAAHPAFIGAFALGALAFAHPAWVALINVYLAGTEGLRASVPLLTLFVPGALGCAYALLIRAASRAATTRAMDAMETSLLASATWLVAAGAFTRLSSEAMHFHATSRTIAAAMHLGALAFAIAALSVSVRRRRWAAAAFDAKDAGWHVVELDEEKHAHLPVLGASTRGDPAYDGVILRIASKSNTPYRSNEDNVAIARTWLDEHRAMAPLTRRVTLAACLVGGTVAAMPLVAGGTLRVAHLETGGRHALASDTLTLPAACAKPAPIYFVPLGNQTDLDVPALAQRYEAALGRRCVAFLHRDLPTESYLGGAWSAEGVLETLNSIGGNDAVVIGLTSDPLVYGSRKGFDLYGTRGRHTAVISTRGMQHGVQWRDDADAMVDSRIRKFTTRTIATLYCQLPSKDDPKSVLFRRLMNVADLDGMDESVW